MVREKKAFRDSLEAELLVQWSTKVDALSLYVAELEDKIKQEQEARERLTIMYDQSLALGYNRLTNETANLSQNPLIHEVTREEDLSIRPHPMNELVLTKEQQEMLDYIKAQNAKDQRDSTYRSNRSQPGEPMAGENMVLDRMTQHFRAQVAMEQQNAAGSGSRAMSEQAPLYFMTNHELSGIAGWYDLGDEETCSAAYKNEYEYHAEDFALTKSKIIDLYLSQVSQMEGSLPASGNCQVTSKQTVDGLKERYPSVLERFRFNDCADDVNLFLRSILATHKRKQWDRSIESIKMCDPVIDRNMWILEELSHEMIAGYQERKAKVKTFVFRAGNAFYIYQSSVPDEMYKTVESGDDNDDFDDSHDPTRYTVVFSITCFKRDGNDLILERVRQVDFRQGNSTMGINAYLNTLQTKALYWKQDLTEMITAEILARDQ